MNTTPAHLALPDETWLDCTSEVSDVRSVNSDKRAWLGKDIKPADWLLRLDKAAVQEINRAAEFIIQNPVANMLRTPDDLHLPACRVLFARLREILDNGVGFAVVDKLPVDDFPLETLVELYWTLGQLVAKPVAQKRSGLMIYDVRDTGKQYSYGVRGSWTNVELNFHTDNAFGKKPPEYVGLFCRHPAVTGGISRFCSLYALHRRLQDEYPDALRRLYQPMLYDRQKEHQPGEPAVTLAPFFSWRGDKLRARANPSLVRKGYALVSLEMDDGLAQALETVDKVSSAGEFWFEAALEKGQVQYLNNSEVGHYRSEFTDHNDVERKRHLFRLWHRTEGSVCYDGGYGVQA